MSSHLILPVHHCTPRFWRQTLRVAGYHQPPQPEITTNWFELEAMSTEERVAELPTELRYIQYVSSLESQYLPAIRALISKDLSEPYSIYVYRYFLYQWGELCFMVSN
jgi:hypothetical protein